MKGVQPSWASPSPGVSMKTSRICDDFVLAVSGREVSISCKILAPNFEASMDFAAIKHALSETVGCGGGSMQICWRSQSGTCKTCSLPLGPAFLANLDDADMVCRELAKRVLDHVALSSKVRNINHTGKLPAIVLYVELGHVLGHSQDCGVYRGTQRSSLQAAAWAECSLGSMPPWLWSSLRRCSKRTKDA